MTALTVACPFCESHNTDLFSLFGSSALTSQYYCRDCRTVFEQVKWGSARPGGSVPPPTVRPRVPGGSRDGDPRA